MKNMTASLTTAFAAVTSQEEARRQFQEASAALERAVAGLREQLAQLSIEEVIDLLPEEDRPQILHLDYQPRRLVMLKHPDENIAFIIDTENRESHAGLAVEAMNYCDEKGRSQGVYTPKFALVPWYPTWLPELHEESSHWDNGLGSWHVGEEEYWRAVKAGLKQLGISTLFVPGKYYVREASAERRFDELTIEVDGNVCHWQINFRDIRYYDGSLSSYSPPRLLNYMWGIKNYMWGIKH